MTAAEPSIAELSRVVAEAKGYAEPAVIGGLRYGVNFAEPARLYELEGELLKAGWSFCYWTPNEEPVYQAYPTESAQAPPLTEPGTPDGRVRLILRATLEMNR